MTNDRTEILIQRCVDNECSSEERRELLQLLDGETDGWKTLACTYMEEQLFESACVSKLSETTSAAATPVVAKRATHWFHHPAMSMLLTACVVCLLTVIGLEEYHQRQRPKKTTGTDAAIAAAGTDSAAQRDPENAMSVSREPQTAWFEADGMVPRQLPVYSNVADFIPSLEAFRQQSNQSARDFGLPGSGSRIRYIKLKVGDEYLLFPMEEFAIDRQFQ